MISHEIVLQKLVKYGLNQNSVSSFTSYLSSRNQQCSVNSHLSTNSQINCGITQGSLIGPLLFLLYINDLPSSLDNGTAPMNADGTSIRFAAPTIYDDLEMMINTELANFNTWLKVNNHSLNVAKNEFMTIGQADQRLVLDISCSSHFSSIHTIQLIAKHLPIDFREFFCNYVMHEDHNFIKIHKKGNEHKFQFKHLLLY